MQDCGGAPVGFAGPNYLRFPVAPEGAEVSPLAQVQLKQDVTLFIWILLSEFSGLLSLRCHGCQASSPFAHIPLPFFYVMEKSGKEERDAVTEPGCVSRVSVW